MTRPAPYWDDCAGALRDLADHAPPGLAPLMLQAAGELEQLRSSATAGEKRHEQMVEDIKAVARDLWADDQAYVSDRLSAILAKGETK
jgi:hypothetical protein